MTSAAGLQPLLPRILDRMRCPRCGGPLSASEEILLCRGSCGARYPSHEGIPLLAVHGTAETWEGSAGAETSAEYQQAYQDLEAARAYNESYRAHATKRWSTGREFELLERLLGSQPRSAFLLDLPSGGGRLSNQLARHTHFLIEADIGLGQLMHGRESHDGGDPRVWMAASAFHIPLVDGAVDGVVSCRLSHHLPTPEEQERLVAELLRVARRFVIMTFFDHHSVKNLVRRARRPFNRKPPKMTMTVSRVGELARANGAELIAWPPLSRLFSGHRYALMVKR